MHRLIVLALVASAAAAEPGITRIAAHPSDVIGPPTAADFDRDGDLDLFYLASPAQTGGTDGQGILLENTGGRTFAPPRATHIRHRQDATSPVLGDFTGDAKLDLLVFESRPEVVIDGRITRRPVAIEIPAAGTPTRRVPIEPYPASGWTSLDLDGDSIAELIDNRLLSFGSTSRVAIFERQPDGSFARTSPTLDFPPIAVNDHTLPIDFDFDGDLDLIVHEIATGYPFVLERTGPRSFAPGPHGALANSIENAWHDLDGDHLPDRVVLLPDRDLLWQSNLGTFELGPEQIHKLAPSFENHRLLDVEVRSPEPALLTFGRFQDQSLSLRTVRFGSWETVRTATLDAPADRLVGTPEIDLVDDFDADGHPDALVRYFQSIDLTTSIPRTAIAWGTPTAFEPPVFTSPPIPTAAAPLVADLDLDGDPDLILGPDADGTFHALLNDGRGRFSASIALGELAPPAGAPADTRISGIVAGLIDGDTIPDLAVSYTAGEFLFSQSATGVAFGRGDGTFDPPLLPQGSFDFLSTHAIGELIDWDGDGDLDGLTGGGWRENLGGVFDPATRYLIHGAITSDALGNPTSLEKFATGDLDGDGHRDILSIVHRIVVDDGGPLGGLGPWEAYAAVGFGDGNGGIEEIVEFPAATAASDFLGNARATDAAIVDLNADGFMDLVIEEFSSSDALGNPVTTVSWWRNPGNGSRDPSTWTKLPLNASVPAGPMLDFDADGSLEWVSPAGFVQPTISGPRVSARHDFISPAHLNGLDPLGSADFDGDGDADFLLGDGQLWLVLVRNRIVDEGDAIARLLAAHGIPESLAGASDDADGDGRDNFTELLDGTDLTAPDERPSDVYQITLGTTPHGFRVAFRLPWRAVGIGSAQSPVTLDDLGITLRPETSTDLLQWQGHDVLPEDATLQGDPWTWFTKDFASSEPTMFFRLRGDR